MAYTKEELLAAYRKLPETIKEVVSGIESVKILKRIGEHHQLHIDQLGELANEVSAVLFGLNRAEDFGANLKKRLGFDDQRTGEIAVEINREIFLPAREQIKLANESAGGGPADEGEATASPSATTSTPPLPTSDEILREIENPPAAEVYQPTAASSPNAALKTNQPPETTPSPAEKNVFEQKMAGPFPPKPKINDPYLEPIE